MIDIQPYKMCNIYIYNTHTILLYRYYTILRSKDIPMYTVRTPFNAIYKDT